MEANEVVNEYAVGDFNISNETPDQPAAVDMPAPATTPEATAPTSPATTPAIPLDVLNQSLRSVLGESYRDVQTPEEFAQILGNKHKEMREKQELAAQAQNELRQYKPFINRMNSDKAYERRVYETSLEYAERLNGQPDAGAQTDAASPLYGEVLELKNWKEQKVREEADKFINDSLESIAKDPDYAPFLKSNPDALRQVAIDCAATGNFDPEAVFSKRYGKQVIAHAKAEATREHSARIQATNAAGAGLGVPTSAAPMAVPMADPATMPAADANKWADAELERIKRDKKYAAQVAREWQEENAGQE